MKRENQIQKEIILSLNSKFQEGRFWRNETGVFLTKEGRWVSSGLCKGSSDIIGIIKGKFVALEIKSRLGRVSTDQKKFIEIVRECGGVAEVVRNKEEAEGVIIGILGRA